MNHSKEEMFEKLMALIRKGHEAVINHEEVDEYEAEVRLFLDTHLENYKKELVERVEAELGIQKKVQEKSKEVVAIGRARVAGMVAEKHTRIGKIEALSDIITLITEK
jgi:hypothetical protein